MGEAQIREYTKTTKLTLVLLSTMGLTIIILFGWNTVLMESESKTLPESMKAADYYDFNMPDTNISRDIYLNLRAAIAVNNKNGKVLYSFNANEIRPIASISKLLTAMVVLDNYNPNKVIEITRQDARKSAKSLFRTGTKVRAKDLLHAALLQSDNRSARALARTVAGSYEDFAILMNKKAREIGLEDTEMDEPTGLDERNCSTAADCARLVINAMIHYPEIARITSLKKYEFSPINKKRNIRLINTNKMVFSKYKVRAGKTGYIIKSDYCVATVLENGKGKQITIVVLGSPGPNTRFREARRLANYAFRKLG
jgi:D-alanyl-D-alanine endopeptidase (penicillin-binding protein 7)